MKDLASSPTTIATMSLISILYIVGFFVADDYLRLSVGHVINLRPWIYVTSGLYEAHIWQLVVPLLQILALGTQAEKSIGSVSLAKMLIFANLLSSFATFCAMLTFYILFRRPILLATEFSGTAAILAALLIAKVQKMPTEPLACLSKLKIRQLPFLIIVMLHVLFGLVTYMH